MRKSILGWLQDFTGTRSNWFYAVGTGYLEIKRIQPLATILLMQCFITLPFKVWKFCEIICKSCRVKAYVLQNHWNASELQIVAKLKAPSSFFKGSTLTNIRKLSLVLVSSFWGLDVYVANYYWTVWEDEEEGEAQQTRVPEESRWSELSSMMGQKGHSISALKAGLPCARCPASLSLRLLICKARGWGRLFIIPAGSDTWHFNQTSAQSHSTSPSVEGKFISLAD